MKKIIKSIGIVIVSCIILSFCIPKGGPDWFHTRSQYISDESYNDYDIVVDFSKPSCEDRLFIYCNKSWIEPELIYSGATLLPFNLPGVNFPLTKASEGCFAVSYHTYNAIKSYMKQDTKHKTKLIAYYGE